MTKRVYVIVEVDQNGSVVKVRAVLETLLERAKEYALQLCRNEYERQFGRFRVADDHGNVVSGLERDERDGRLYSVI